MLFKIKIYISKYYLDTLIKKKSLPEPLIKQIKGHLDKKT